MVKLNIFLKTLLKVSILFIGFPTMLFLLCAPIGIILTDPPHMLLLLVADIIVLMLSLAALATWKEKFIDLMN